MTDKKNVYDYVTDRIIADLQAGNITWRKTWQGGQFPKNFESGRDYRGINVWLLSMQNDSSPYWLTSLQTKNKGGKIIDKDNKQIVVYYKLLEFEKADSDDKRKIPFLRYSTVYNADNISGIDFPKLEKNNNNPIEKCQQVVNGFPNPKVEIKQNGFKPCYIPSLDKIEIPELDSFDDSQAYYATLFHELIHSTGHKHRLDRGAKSSFGSELYAKEELIAELGSSFLCHKTGIDNNAIIENEAAYIQNWLKALKNDRTLIVKASSKAQKAAEYILGN